MSPITRISTPAARERGAIILTFAMMLLFLLGFAAIAMDLGRLFIVRTELQTALDSCALAAAQELDGQSTSITRALNAGVTAGNLNNVNLQSSTWDGQSKLAAGDISFKSASYTATTDPLAARYAQCQHTQPSVKTWLLPALAVVGGFATPNSVSGTAVATRASAQSACPVPVGLRGRNSTPPDYGFTVGEWVTIYGKNIGAGPGELGWYNLDGSTNASETTAELGTPGVCGVKVGDVLGTPGAQNSVDTAWNQRFGIYKNSDSAALSHPDLTGYAYTAYNWKNTVPQNAYSGTAAAGSATSAENFLAKRASFASFDNTGTSLTDGSNIVYGVTNKLNSFKSIATPGSTGDHAKYGFSRRLVIVPVLTSSSAVADFACMLMLAPMTGPSDDVQMEYRGNASATSSPCTTNGIAGGSAGPLVPVLVR
ncbi:pilus assembly protein TadG-related protein [Massilia terrae]|uniref:Tad domain-containing protein n=1 Tax=Massilia terrae TaxID=1811224 RepID=A0ABT2CX61_9BURK|nr:Tad domain-containing protein [Massilia terrae]MCS0658554.1 Tad domain-containing protein [Massilia terrae]